MLFSDVTRVAAEVAATPSRLAKIELLSVLLAQAAPDEVAPLVGLLLGRPRQGRLGVGWASVSSAASRVDGSSAVGDPLRISDIDDALTALAQVQGGGSVGRREAILDDLVARASADEIAFLWRVILGDVRTGALEGVLTDAAAKAAEVPVPTLRRAAMLMGDLGLAARLAREQPQALGQVGLTVGIPVQPMLASTAADVSDAIGLTGPASVEFKLDGARIQVHRRGADVQIYTRSLADITHRLPEIVDLVRGFPREPFVLDGETLTLDEDGAPKPFQDTMSRFGADLEREAVMRPWFFDVLAADGVDLLDTPLRERLAVLRSIVGELAVPGETTADVAVAERVAVAALAAGHEGVVVKGLETTYSAGRRGKHWVKVKPVHTYDLVVLAAEFGSGRRTGWLSNLHLGARDPHGRYGEPGGFVMVGKTFKGLTDATLRWQTARFPQIETHRDTWGVSVEPVIVVEIAIDGVQRSRRYPGGLALRFARVKAYREDKPAADADTIETLQAMLR